MKSFTSIVILIAGLQYTLGKFLLSLIDQLQEPSKVQTMNVKELIYLIRLGRGP